MKAETKPRPNIGKSAIDSAWRSLTTEYTVAPSIVGMARKNENSVAALRDRPNSMPPMMVEPERLVPGIRAKDWAKPTLRASSAVIWSTVSTRGGVARWRWRCSTHRMMTPPTTRAIATGTGWNRSSVIVALNSTPMMAAGRKAMTTLRAKRCWSGSEPSPENRRVTRSRYSQTTASTAPSWITILNTVSLTPVKLSNSPARIR